MSDVSRRRVGRVDDLHGEIDRLESEVERLTAEVERLNSKWSESRAAAADRKLMSDTWFGKWGERGAAIDRVEAVLAGRPTTTGMVSIFDVRAAMEGPS